MIKLLLSFIAYEELFVDVNLDLLISFFKFKLHLTIFQIGELVYIIELILVFLIVRQIPILVLIKSSHTFRFHIVIERQDEDHNAECRYISKEVRPNIECFIVAFE